MFPPYLAPPHPQWPPRTHQVGASLVCTMYTDTTHIDSRIVALIALSQSLTQSHFSTHYLLAARCTSVFLPGFFPPAPGAQPSQLAPEMEEFLAAGEAPYVFVVGKAGSLHL